MLSLQCMSSGGVLLQFEEMYEQKRKEVNKAAEKFEKQLKAAKKSGSKANTDKVAPSQHTSSLFARLQPRDSHQFMPCV